MSCCLSIGKGCSGPSRSAAQKMDARSSETPRGVAVPPLGAVHYSTQYDISADGRRVYFLDRQPRDPPRDISVIVGWRELIN